MAENSNIEWTTHTLNPWRGCTKVSAGCANCYAETMSVRNPAVLGEWGPKGTRVVASESMWREPLKWNKAAAKAGERHRVFCASLADVFEDWSGVMVDSSGRTMGVCRSCGWADATKKLCGKWTHHDLKMQDVRRRLFDLIDRTPNLDWLLLTKRPQNIWPMVDALDLGIGEGTFAERFPNVWIGTSVEDQQTADSRIPHLLKVPAKVRFLSCEPLMGPLEFSNASKRADGVAQLGKKALDGIHWVIVGGESGPDSRTCRVEWVRSIVEQCKAAQVPVFVKQLGDSVTTTLPDGEQWNGGNGLTGHLKFSGDGFGNYQVLGLKRKGGNVNEWPTDLVIREFPEV